MGAVVAVEIEGGDDQAGHRSSRLLDDLSRTSQREHGTVVVAVGVEVEQARAGGPADGAEEVRVTTFADVDHALDQFRGQVASSERSPAAAGSGSPVGRTLAGADNE